MSLTIKYNGEEATYENQFAILDALEEAGLDPDYSCRSGACEACKCQLVSGEVEWVQNPSVSLGKDEILTCSTIPKTDLELIQL